jgi:tetratricopeptide (TPR) repeat protein
LQPDVRGKLLTFRFEPSKIYEGNPASFNPFDAFSLQEVPSMNARLCRNLCLAAALLSSGPPAVACLWDKDTRSMEEQKFPETLALITGGFLRHSHDFYEWRIEQRLKDIEQHPDKLELYDDLAVAYEKTGDTAKAIEITEELLQRDPDRYETLANLGTFYIHNGELERGIEYIDKALQVNPDAHFGRERYQKYVVQYVLSKRNGDELTLPLDTDFRGTASDTVGFTRFLFEKVQPADQEAQDAEVAKAVKGVLGMMRFGNFDSPVLLECLGDLLIFGGEGDSALHLATRAYLKASYEAKDEDAKAEYRKIAEMATDSISAPKTTVRLPLANIEEQFQEELKQAEAWVQDVFADERRWIAEGADVEQRYEEKYYTEPAPAPDLLAGTEPPAPEPSEVKRSLLLWVVVIAIFALFLFWAMSHQYAKINKANKEEADTQ